MYLVDDFAILIDVNFHGLLILLEMDQILISNLTAVAYNLVLVDIALKSTLFS